MLKRLLLCALAAGLLLATAGAAQAQTYPPEVSVEVGADGFVDVPDGANLGIVGDAKIEVLGSITIRLGPFPPGTVVRFYLRSEPIFLGTAIADSTGYATLTATVPDGVNPGAHHVEATGTNPDGTPVLGPDGKPLTYRTAVKIAKGTEVLGETVTRPALAADSSDDFPTQLAIGGAAIAGLLLLLNNRRKGTADTADARETADV